MIHITNAFFQEQNDKSEHPNALHDQAMISIVEEAVDKP